MDKSTDVTSLNTSPIICSCFVGKKGWKCIYFWELRRPRNKDKEMVKNTIEKNSLEKNAFSLRGQKINWTCNFHKYIFAIVSNATTVGIA